MHVPNPTLSPVSEHPISIRTVSTRAEHRLFRNFPYTLYSDDTNWVAPLRRNEDARWKQRRNPTLKYRDCTRFVAIQSGKVIGRVAAIVDSGFEQRWSADTGFFGFFECVNRDDVAAALVEAVEADLRSRGKRHLLGPVNLSMHDEVGTLVDGFSRPTILSPYNPPFYSALIEHAGFTPRQTYQAYHWTPDITPQVSVERLLRRLRMDTSLRVRPTDPRRWNAEVETLHKLYNACFAHVWGFVPLRLDEFRHRAAGFRSYFRPELVLFAENHGQPVGFCVLLPDINDALRDVHGRLFPFGWLKLAIRARHVRTARFILLGVLPEFSGKGIAALIGHEAGQAARRIGMREVELSLVLESNDRVRHVVRAFGGRLVKTFRLFGKDILRGKHHSGALLRPTSA